MYANAAAAYSYANAYSVKSALSAIHDRRGHGYYRARHYRHGQSLRLV